MPHPLVGNQPGRNTSRQTSGAEKSTFDSKELEDGNRITRDGSRHQLAISSKPRRKHPLSALDLEYASAVYKDAEEVEFTAAEEKKVLRKIDNVVLPLIICSYVFSQFDRTNIGNAYLTAGFKDQYSITSNQKWLLALSVFYIGYGLLEMPANILLRRIGANRFFFLSMLFWGLSSLSFVYAKGYGGLLILRLLLGIGEAGFHAGMVFYLSFWYKRDEVALRIGVGLNGTLPGALGGLLAFGLVRAHTKILAGWQFLFLIEALPTLIMAFMNLLFLPSFPFSATFLTPRERAIAQARLNRDQKPQSHGGMSALRGVKTVLKDMNVWLLMIAHASFNIGVSTISYFLPTLVKDLGFSAVNAQGLSVAPHVAGFAFVVLQAWHSDHTKERSLHAMLSSAMSVVGYIMLATLSEKCPPAAFFALFLVVAGNFSLFPLILGWTANTLAPTSKRGVGVAFVISVSNCVLVSSAWIYDDPQNRYRRGHAICAGMLALTFISVFLLRMRLIWRNKHNKKRLERLSIEEKRTTGVELWDSDPRYVFMT